MCASENSNSIKVGLSDDDDATNKRKTKKNL